MNLGNRLSLYVTVKRAQSVNIKTNVVSPFMPLHFWSRHLGTQNAKMRLKIEGLKYIHFTHPQNFCGNIQTQKFFNYNFLSETKIITISNDI
jgi:hypothetical protein